MLIPARGLLTIRDRFSHGWLDKLIVTIRGAHEIKASSSPHSLPNVSMDSTVQSVRRHKVWGINDYADFSSPDKLITAGPAIQPSFLFWPEQKLRINESL